jgi:uncharacterized protein (DUF58 family)
VTARPATFPLISRRRGISLLGGTQRSTYRGTGYETASSRPYRRGDSMRAIDWSASARLSSARQADEFIVREHFAEDSLRVVVFVDRSPTMSLYPSELPWLHKPDAVAAAGRMIVDSAIAGQALSGYLDLAEPRRPRWLPPRRQQNAIRIRDRELRLAAYTAPPDNLALGLRHLAHARRDIPAGSFVFVLSDFLTAPAPAVWQTASGLGWDLVPVIFQDRRWEQSFPDVAGFALPFASPDRDFEVVRLTRRETAARRNANERRFAGLLRSFASLDIDPVLVSSNDRTQILSAFLGWHDRRRSRLRRR